MTSGTRFGADNPIGDAELGTFFAPLGSATGILAAVSGGPDSTALMGLLSAWGKHRAAPPPVTIATVDHRLRPCSRREAEAVGEAARALGLLHAILTWSADGRPVSQARARDGRYGLLARHAATIGATHLVTAHTLDDQAETVMMRLAGGSGLGGLAGMRPATRLGPIHLLRPFLTVPKSRLVATCRQRGWPYVDDPSNADPRYARARWRREIMPLLAAEGLNAARLGRLAARAGRIDDALDAVAADTLRRVSRQDGDRVVLDGAALLREPAEIGLRVLGLALQDRVADGPAAIRLERLEACHEAMTAALGNGTPLRRTLGGNLLVLDRQGTLTITPEGPRRRGQRDPVTPIGEPAEASLGMEPPRA